MSVSEIRACSKYAGGGYFIRPDASALAPSPVLHAPEVVGELLRHADELGALVRSEYGLKHEWASACNDWKAMTGAGAAEAADLRVLLNEGADLLASFLWAEGVDAEKRGLLLRTINRTRAT